jgi:hypothetical protein
VKGPLPLFNYSSRVSKFASPTETTAPPEGGAVIVPYADGHFSEKPNIYRYQRLSELNVRSWNAHRRAIRLPYPNGTRT